MDRQKAKRRITFAVVFGRNTFQHCAEKKQTVQTKEDQIGQTCSTKGEMKNSVEIINGKHAGKRQFRRSRRKKYIKMNLQQTWTAFTWLTTQSSSGLL